MKKSIEKITYCFVIIAALFVSFVSFVEPLVMKDINITKVILVLLCYAAVFAGSLTLFRRLSERTLYYLTIAGIFAAVIDLRSGLDNDLRVFRDQCTFPMVQYIADGYL